MTDALRFCPMTVASICVIGLLLTAMIVPAAAVAAVQPPQPEADNTVTRIQVSPNGSAQWTIQIRTRLDTDDRVDEYEAFQARFREDTSRYLSPFRDRMRGVVANAANTTGREMRAVNFTAATSVQEVPRRWGIVTYQFTWTHFVAQLNETLTVGDVFQGGLFLATNDTLEIEAPEGYQIARVDPTPASRDDGVVTWVGREDFANHHPHVMYSPMTNQDATTGAQQTSTQPSTPDGATSSPFGDMGLGVVLSGTLLVSLVSIAAYTVWRRRDNPSGIEQFATMSPNVDAAAATHAPTDDPLADEMAMGAAVKTDTERVQELLEANDGRIRQTAIADEFDWSASKTSRVIGKLVNEGTIEKLQLGRENLINLLDADK